MLENRENEKVLIRFFKQLLKVDTAQRLLQVIVNTDKKGKNYLHKMVAIGNYRFIKEIIVQRLGYNITATDEYSRSPLLVLVISTRAGVWDEQQIAFIQWLLARSRWTIAARNEDCVGTMRVL